MDSTQRNLLAQFLAAVTFFLIVLFGIIFFEQFYHADNSNKWADHSLTSPMMIENEDGTISVVDTPRFSRVDPRERETESAIAFIVIGIVAAWSAFIVYARIA